MRRPAWSRWLTTLAWVVLLFDLILVLAIPADTSFDGLFPLITYTFWVLASPILASTWLVIRHREIFRTRPGWVMPIIVLILSNWGYVSIPSSDYPNLSLLAVLLFAVSGWIIGVATATLLWYRDAGLALVGWGSVVAIWAYLLAWRFQGNLVELTISALSRPNEPSPLWWNNSLMCVLGWILPLGFIGFLAHTVRLIVQELR